MSDSGFGLDHAQRCCLYHLWTIATCVAEVASTFTLISSRPLSINTKPCYNVVAYHVVVVLASVSESIRERIFGPCHLQTRAPHDADHQNEGY